jgi:YidC/Oxa1 family membrane protein insertase
VDRNAFLALLFSIAVFMLWAQWQEARWGDAPPPLAEGEQTAPPGARVPAPAPSTARRAADDPAESVLREAPVDDGLPDRRIAVETSFYSAELSSHGAALTNWELTRFVDKSLGDDRPVVLTTLDAQLERALATPFEELGLGDLSQASYTVQRPGPLSVVFTRERGGFALRKRYDFDDASYTFRLRIEIENNGNTTVSPAFEVLWPSTVQESSDFADHSLVALVGGSVEREPLASLGSPGFLSRGPFVAPRFDGNVDWAGAESRYFLAVLLPELPREAAASFEPLEPGVRALTRVRYRPFPIGPGQSVAREFRGYIGPKEIGHLDAAGAQLDRSLRLGWSFLAPMTRLFSWLLRVFYGLVPNYGVAIILLTLLVKLVTFPLTQKSLKSMQGMAALQPKMKALQEKYKDDKQKQSQELMKLYKQAGTNPIAGCLPMLLQFPFFIGLYYALQSSIALRQAPFVGWIQDLSIPETLFYVPGLELPVRILPLVMGGSMVLSQRMTPTTMDPMQARMMNTVMPVMFTVLFYQFASGLVLYWLVNNLLQIGQQAYLRRQQSAPKDKIKKEGGA